MYGDMACGFLSLDRRLSLEGRRVRQVHGTDRMPDLSWRACGGLASEPNDTHDSHGWTIMAHLHSLGMWSREYIRALALWGTRAGTLFYIREKIKEPKNTFANNVCALNTLNTETLNSQELSRSRTLVHV